MTMVDWVVVALVVLALLGMAVYGYRQYNIKRKRNENAASALLPTADKSPYKISYVPSDMEWSGSISGAMPLKTLTYKQYECLEDARYGFKVVGLTTVASLVRHGFLIADGADGYAITDHGLNALEVCDVRY